MMSVAAARALKDVNACFVGIGLPSTGANLARRTHAPGPRARLRGGRDRRQAAAAAAVASATACSARPPTRSSSVPEIFNYWVQSGRIDVGFLGAAQIDRFANINTTVIGGDYDHPKVRLPGAGGAPEIAASLRRGDRDRAPEPARVRGEGRLRHLGRPRRAARASARSSGCAARGRREVITDLGILEPDPRHQGAGAHARCTKA